jgi:bacterioferritin
MGRGYLKYAEDNSDPMVDTIDEDFDSERMAIDSYHEMVNLLGDDNPTIRRMMEEIVASEEEEHVDDLVIFLEEPRS